MACTTSSIRSIGTLSLSRLMPSTPKSSTHIKCPHEVNSTYFCLIPKCANATMLRNFRPIVICNTVYKLVTKIIVNMVKPHLSTIISPSQVSFLSNWRAFDHAIIVHEYVFYFNNIKGNGANISSKLTLKKSLICLNSHSLGAPPSSIIFLNAWSNSSCHASLQHQSPSSWMETWQTHSSLLDPPLLCWWPTLFARANKKNCESIIRTLNSFNSVSGQKVNMIKSKVIYSKTPLKRTWTSLPTTLALIPVPTLANT